VSPLVNLDQTMSSFGVQGNKKTEKKMYIQKEKKT